VEIMTTIARTRHADRYGLSLSTSSQTARDAYVEGADAVLSMGAGAEAHFRTALEADPDFALAHIGLARAMFLMGKAPQARDAAAAARQLAVHATDRERSHINALALAIEGHAAKSLTATREHLASYPRDAMVLAPASSVLGLIGFSGSQRREQEQLELLRSLAPHYGEDWWFLGMLSFAACECGELDEAWDLIERSRAGNPRNPYVAHNRVHVFLEKGESERAATYLAEWMADCPKEVMIHCHLSWHLALFALELGNPERAWEIYREHIHPGRAWGPPILIATDAPAFLWRAELAGEPRRPAFWGEVREYADRSFPHARIAFADIHRAVACAVTGDRAALEQLIRELRDGMETGILPAGPVTETLVEAFGAFGEGDWGRAITLFERALPETVRIGGSRAQRDLVWHTLVAAYLKAGRAAAARELIAARLGRRAVVDVEGFEMH
jgi:tetratricopeptide (TPR) repeat protein